MKLKVVLLLFLITVSAETASAIFRTHDKSNSDSLFVTKRTNKAPLTVVDGLRREIEKKGLKVFGEISHSTEAEKAGDQLRFTHVIIFGNPKVGTKLMQCDQRIGYELPLRILVTVNAEGETLLSFQDPKNYTREYQLDACKIVLEKMSNLLQELTNAVL